MKPMFLPAVMLAAALATVSAPEPALSHCDTLDGPVVTDARAALAAGDVTPVLKWVDPEREAEVRAAFERTAAVRDDSPEAAELADLWFFETVVRLHRAGEGEPYAGLQPAGSVPEPIAAADVALEQGSVDALVAHVQAAVAEGIRSRFREVREARQHKDENVAAGRQYVGRYVQWIHYVEELHGLVAGGHAEGSAAREEGAAHGHPGSGHP